MYINQLLAFKQVASVLAYEGMFRAFQTSDWFVFRRRSFLCHHWPLLLVFLEAARLLVLFILVKNSY